jgi:hypothetical protein
MSAAVRPSVWHGFRMIWHEIGFTALPAAQLLALLDELVDPEPKKRPSPGKPGRHAKHGLYCKRAAGEDFSKHEPLSKPGADGAGDEVTHD